MGRQLRCHAAYGTKSSLILLEFWLRVRAGLSSKGLWHTGSLFPSCPRFEFLCRKLAFGYVGIVLKVKIFKKSPRLKKYSIKTRSSNGVGCSSWVMPGCVSRIYIHSITLHSKFSLEHGYGANDMLDSQFGGLPSTSAHYHGRSVPRNGPVSSREPLKC